MNIDIDLDRVTLFGQVLTRPPYVPVGTWREQWSSVRDVFDGEIDAPEDLEKQVAGLETELKDQSAAMDALQDENEALTKFRNAVEKALVALP